MDDPRPNPAQHPQSTALQRTSAVWGCAVSCATNDAVRRMPVGRHYKELAQHIRQRTLRRHGSASSWLNDAAGTRSKGLTAASQLARLVAEMEAAGFTPDEQDAALLQLVRSARETVAMQPPAA